MAESADDLLQDTVRMVLAFHESTGVMKVSALQKLSADLIRALRPLAINRPEDRVHDDDDRQAGIERVMHQNGYNARERAIYLLGYKAGMEKMVNIPRDISIEKNIIDGQIDPDLPYKVMVGSTPYYYTTITDAERFIRDHLSG